MRIRLTEDEVYEIKMPEEINVGEFQSIVSKFNFLLKNFAKFNVNVGEIVVTTNGHSPKTHNKSKWNFLRNNRDAVIDIYSAHYLKDREDFFKVLKKHNLLGKFTKSDMASTSMTTIREIHEITPEEVGLIRFPTKQEQVIHLRLDNQKNEGENQ